MRHVAATASRGSAGPLASGVGEIIALARRVANIIRTLIGAPDYERYVAHMREHHPQCAVASRDEFMTQRLESRYSRPGSRCC